MEAEVVDLREKIRGQWSERIRGRELDLPSGATVLIRPISLMGLVEQGKIPNTLYAMTQKLLEEDDSSLKDPEQVKQMAELAKVLCVTTLIFPTIVDEDPKYPDEILFSDLADVDVVAIVQYAQKGTDELKKFREQQDAANQIGQDSQKVLDKTERDSGDSGPVDSVPG